MGSTRNPDGSLRVNYIRNHEKVIYNSQPQTSGFCKEEIYFYQFARADIFDLARANSLDSLGTKP